MFFFGKYGLGWISYITLLFLFVHLHLAAIAQVHRVLDSAMSNVVFY